MIAAERENEGGGKGVDQVRSVEELLQRAAERGMPLEKMRFFINEDRKEPRCFGIYQDEYTGHWIVYKNKDDGSRSVRYAGPDEAYAAQEIWAKINSEIELRRAKIMPADPRTARMEKIKKGVAVGVVALLLGAFVVYEMKQPRRGYYVYNDDIIYFQNDYWYYYDDVYDDWTYYNPPADEDWYQDAWYGKDYPFEDSGDSFDHSDYYEEPGSYSDSDSDIYDSWDSGDTDWSSDW